MYFLFPRVRKLVSIQTKYRMIRISDQQIICTILIALKMSTVKVLTGGKSPGEPLLLAKVPAEAMCLSLDFSVPPKINNKDSSALQG